MKITWTIGLLKHLEIIPQQYLKHIEKQIYMTYELVLATTFLEYSASLIEISFVIILNGFRKNTENAKTEIDSIKLKKEYYED